MTSAVLVSYHVHHINPNRNFGLTEPSDRLWDWILGVNTIQKLDPAAQIGVGVDPPLLPLEKGKNLLTKKSD